MRAVRRYRVDEWPDQQIALIVLVERRHCRVVGRTGSPAYANLVAFV
jgi:hypothetical protein